MAIPRLCVLVSGGGTTLQNLIDKIATGAFSAEIAGVISSKAEAYGVTRAQKANIPVTVVVKGTSFAEHVWKAVKAYQPDLVIFGGWLHLLPVPQEYRGKVLNIHPSLLPAFGGKGMYGYRVHEAVLAAGEKQSGCTVHYVDDSYDSGPIIMQKMVPVLVGDTSDSLAKRVFEAECELYPDAISTVWKRMQNPLPTV